MTPLAQTLESSVTGIVSVLLPAIQPGINAALLAAVPPGTQVVLAPVIAAIEADLTAALTPILGSLFPQAPVPTAEQTVALNGALAALEAAIAAKSATPA
jgi:hypothetical protein